MVSRETMLVLAGALLFLAFCNGEEERISWQARVVTSDKWGAGTDANVYIQIIGSEGKTREIELDNDSNNFERKDTDVFYFETTDIGTPSDLRVWHDNDGTASSWHLNRIELIRMEKEFTKSYVFNCDCWLAWDEGDKRIDRTIPVSTSLWKAWVHTSDIDSAGTDNTVSIVIYGDKDHTRQIRLNNGGDDHERGETNSYMIDIVDIGTPYKVKVITEKGDRWHLDKIELENMDGAAKYTFDCDCWLAEAGQEVIEIKVSKP